NLRALIDADRDGRLGGRIVVVISNRADAAGLAFAEEAGIETLILPHAAYPSREIYDETLVRALTGRHVRLVCLAGFMPLGGWPRASWPRSAGCALQPCGGFSQAAGGSRDAGSSSTTTMPPRMCGRLKRDHAPIHR